jgi:hypothetical protein
MYPNAGTLHAWKFVYIETDPAKWDHDVENIMKTSDPWVDQQVARVTSTQTNFNQKRQAESSNAGE